MGLFSVFKRDASASPTLPAANEAEASDSLRQARTRARRRLIGAIVLVGIGIVGFPMLFETHPRPIPIDTPIAIANKDKAPPLAMPPARAPTASAVTNPASTPETAVTPTPPASKSAAPVAASVPVPVPTTVAKAPVTAPPPAAKPASSASEAARVRALLEDKNAGARGGDAAASAPRYVVQVGAFADANAARDTRQKLERLGLNTYVQKVDTPNGSRIRVRVGPYSSRDEADRIAGKVKSAGLQATLLTL